MAYTEEQIENIKHEFYQPWKKLLTLSWESILPILV